MAQMPALFDALLALLLVWLAWQALHAADIFRAVLSFMVFGLLMALAWVRLDAPDIALAEAAIGAGVTGALLLSAVGRLTSEELAPDGPRLGPLRFWIPAATLLLLLLALAMGRLAAPGLGEAVDTTLARSGVDNPVTAVLLNFRAFDTLLEIAVLLLATVTVWSLGPLPWPIAPAFATPALPALGRALFPVFWLAAAYLLWRGTHAPGGAFPAGAVLGACGVLVLLAGARPWLTGGEQGPWRTTLALGLAAMLAVAAGAPAAGQSHFFEYPPALAGALILMLELAAGLSIGLLLFALFLGGEPPERWYHGELP